MKTVALKLEAETKTLGAMIELLDAQITRTVALADEIIESGGNADAVTRGLDALEILDKEVRQAKRAYLVFHGIVKDQIKPDGPQPRTGT